jgi:hypothetical protein
MAVWEYLEVETRLSYHKYRTFVNGKEANYISKINRELFLHTLHECPNYYGKKGWELIKMGGSGTDLEQKRWFLFKRQNSS